MAVAHRTANIEDPREAASDTAAATPEWTAGMAVQRHKARSQMLWMVDKARHAANNQRVDDSRWWREKAVCALWNMN